MTADLEGTLARAEEALSRGVGLSGTGFWRAVTAVRRDRELAGRYADRLAAIDRRAFEAGVKLRVPAGVGLAALAAISAFGVVAVVLASRAGAPPPRRTLTFAEAGLDLYGIAGFVPVVFLVGLGALLLGTHCLAHWVAGRALGIRFTHVFLGGPPPPRPGLKTDYASYLRASPTARAVMHASGAVVTKIVPFALLAFSLPLYDSWPWLTWLLLALGVVQVATDVFISTKSSDWMKVLRELRSR